jgi:glycosyltransferase involved in cell wall biosynthesis
VYPSITTARRARRFVRRVASEGPRAAVTPLSRYLRAIVARVVLRVRRLAAKTSPSYLWPRVRYRAIASTEREVRALVGFITELVIRVVPKPKPPIRSVVHVSLISHKQYMLSRLARDHGLKGTFVAINTYPGAHLKIGFDYEVPMHMPPLLRYLRAHWYLWTVLAFHDVIHYHFNGFLLDDGTDLKVLQRMGKVVVAHYRGCDLRCRSVNTAKNPDLNVCQECSYPVGSCDTDYQRGKIAVSRAYSDVRFVTTPDLLDFGADAEHLPFIAPYGIDFSAIEPAPRAPGVFRVVTSSNHPALDGVRFVRDAVNRLAAEGIRIELVEVYRQSFYEALSIYKSADLYCGKLRLGYYNNANIESLMLGVPNMSYIRDEFKDRIADSPIIVARPDNVYEQLREWVGKPEELKRLGARGPDFVRRHHHADELMARMIARYNQALHAKVAARHEAAVRSSLLH